MTVKYERYIYGYKTLNKEANCPPLSPKTSLGWETKLKSNHRKTLNVFYRN